jgi:hypothetical protein
VAEIADLILTAEFRQAESVAADLLLRECR